MFYWHHVKKLGPLLLGIIVMVYISVLGLNVNDHCNGLALILSHSVILLAYQFENTTANENVKQQYFVGSGTKRGKLSNDDIYVFSSFCLVYASCPSHMLLP